MTMTDSIREIQTRSLDQMKSAQEQIVSYNERIADTVVGALPDWQPPFTEYLPSPTEVVKSYYSFIGELHQANLDFATRITSAWEQGDEPTERASKAKKA